MEFSGTGALPADTDQLTELPLENLRRETRILRGTDSILDDHKSV